MYEVSKELKECLLSDNPHFLSEVSFSDFSIDSNGLYKILTDGGSSSSEDIAPGDIVVQSITIEAELVSNAITGQSFEWNLRAKSNTAKNVTNKYLSRFTNAQLSAYTIKELSIPFLAEKIPMGHYDVLGCTKTNNHYKIEGSDRLARSDVKYIPTINFPAYTSEITQDICNQLGLTCEKQGSSEFVCRDKKRFLTRDGEKYLVSDFNFRILAKPRNCTMRQMLGYIAGLQGKFGIVDRAGVFCFKWYKRKYCNFQDYSDEPVISEKAVTIRKIICQLDSDGNETIEADCVSGGTKIITMTNPYMTHDFLDGIAKKLVVINYYPCEYNVRCANPCMDVYDMYGYSDTVEIMQNTDGTTNEIYILGLETIPIMNLDYTFDGGLSATIQATASDLTEEV